MSEENNEEEAIDAFLEFDDNINEESNEKVELEFEDLIPESDMKDQEDGSTFNPTSIETTIHNETEEVSPFSNLTGEESTTSEEISSETNNIAINSTDAEEALFGDLANEEPILSDDLDIGTTASVVASAATTLNKTETSHDKNDDLEEITDETKPQKKVIKKKIIKKKKPIKDNKTNSDEGSTKNPLIFIGISAFILILLGVIAFILLGKDKKQSTNIDIGLPAKIETQNTLPAIPELNNNSEIKEPILAIKENFTNSNNIDPNIVPSIPTERDTGPISLDGDLEIPEDKITFLLDKIEKLEKNNNTMHVNNQIILSLNRKLISEFKTQQKTISAIEKEIITLKKINGVK